MNQDEEFKQNALIKQEGAKMAELQEQVTVDFQNVKQVQENFKKLTDEVSDLREKNIKTRLELSTLRFKESQEQRFIWWIWNVFSKNVCDLIYSIKCATTYVTEAEAKEGKYGLPIKCFEILRRVEENTMHIVDGTYLDIEVSTENKTVPENKTSPDNNKPLESESSVTQNVCSWIQEDDPEINLWRTACHNTFYLDADKPSDNHMKYCCYCGKKIKEEV